MSTNMTHLENQLLQAEETLTNFVSEIGTNFNNENMARITALQSVVSSAREDLETAKNEEASRLNPQQGSGTGSTLVRFIGTGKSEIANIEVSSGTMVGRALQILSETYPDTWGYVSDLTKIRVQRWRDDGSCIDIHNPSTSKLDEGTCNIWVGNKVAGGSL